ncbi:hypothetical protein D3C75_730450 [compost metagenome]
MTGKKRLIHGDVLQAHSAFAFFHLKNPVDKQKRMAVRDNLLYFFNIHHDKKSSSTDISTTYANVHKFN